MNKIFHTMLLERLQGGKSNHPNLEVNVRNVGAAAVKGHAIAGVLHAK